MNGALRATRDMAIVFLVLVIVSDVAYTVEQGLVGWLLLGKVATAGAIIWILRQAMAVGSADDGAGRGPPPA